MNNLVLIAARVRVPGAGQAINESGSGQAIFQSFAVAMAFIFALSLLWEIFARVTGNKQKSSMLGIAGLSLALGLVCLYISYAGLLLAVVHLGFIGSLSGAIFAVYKALKGGDKSHSAFEYIILAQAWLVASAFIFMASGWVQEMQAKYGAW
jgi:hypothetical protein